MGWLRTRLVLAFLVVGAALSFAAPYQPDRKDPLRKELLDAARPTFEDAVGGQIEFVVKQLNVIDDWAFGAVVLQRPGGGRIDWSKTPFAEDEREGMFDPATSFFLLRNVDGAWTTVEFSAGPTDLVWDGWKSDYKLPDDLFTQ